MRNIYFFLLVIFLIPITAEAQLFKPFTFLRVIKTEYFDIIFPPESESSAHTLASYADSVYEKMISLFGIKIPARIPVTFTPHTDMFNGYYNPVPYPHIILYDTPMDVEWTNFENNLEALFTHELAHAVSLNTRSPFFNALRMIFGYWATPSAFNAPYFMVEGVTLSMESITGFGRANDPLIKQRLRQAIHEGKFLTPFQSSGAFDHPNHRGSSYDYGGLFSFYLIQNYGIEKYTELWREMGKKVYLSFVVYRSGFYRIFKNVYEINFMDAWNSFKNSLVLDNIEENYDTLFKKRHHFFVEKKYSISAVAAYENDIYVLDGTERKIRVFNTQTDNIRVINSDAVSSYDLDVSADGKYILVSGYQSIGERYTAVATEYETATGRKTGKSFRRLYKAGYFRGGVIGISSQQHNNNIVYEDFNGKKEILFEGNEELLFSAPRAIDNERFAFVAARKGIRELVIFNYVTSEILRIETVNGEGENILFSRYMRGLSVSQGKLFFSHNMDDRMYKLACIDLDKMQAVFSERDFSGGVFYPVLADNSIFYRGTFFSGDNFFRFPEKADSISGKTSRINLVKRNPNDYGFTALNIVMAEHTVTVSNNIFDNENITNIDKSFSETNNNADILFSKPYFSILYMNPYKLWLPLPLFRYNLSFDNFKFSADGVGIFTALMDPTDRNLIIVFAYADIKYGMAMVDNFYWQNTVLGFPITLTFSDKVINSFDIKPYRETRVSLFASLTHYPGRWSYGLSLGAGYLRVAGFDNVKNANSITAYDWDEERSVFILHTGISFSNVQRRQTELFGTGVSFNLKGVTTLHEFKPRAEAVFRANAEIRFPLNLTLYGAYDETGMNIHGVSNIYGQPLFANNSSREYPLPSGLSSSWLAGAEAVMGIFSFEIQRNLSHIYFNRFLGILSFRNVVYDSQGNAAAEGFIISDIRLAQSLILNLKLVTTFIPLKAVPVFFEPSIWGAWKISSTFTGIGFNLSWGFGLDFRY